MFIYKKIRRSIIRKADDESVLERLMSFIEEHYGLFAAAVFAALSNAGDGITTSAVAEVMNAYRSAAERYRTDNAPETRPFAPEIHTSAPNSGAPPHAAEGPIPIEHILEDTVTGNVIDELVRVFEDNDIQTAYESALSHGITSVSNDLKLPPPNQIQRLLPAPSFHYNEFYERWCSEHCGELIIEISDSQRENVRQIINNALQNGHSVDKAAKEIRRTVGLTERQTWANIRYSDRMYEELKKAHPHMSSTTLRKLADEAADKYAQTQRRKRSIDIARTELAKAQMQASLEYIKWAQELGLIQDIHGEWVTSGNDKTVCSVCRKLNHKAVDLTKDPLPPLHPRCACSIRFVSGTAESEISELRGIKPSDYAQYIRYRDRLGENNVGSIDSFVDLKYNKPEEFDKLSREYHTISEISKKNWSESFKSQAIDAYYEFRNYDIEMSSHAIARFLDRKRGKNNISYSLSDIVDICNQKANYIQPNGRHIKYYNNVAIIYSESSPEIVSIVNRKNPKSDWSEI